MTKSILKHLIFSLHDNDPAYGCKSVITIKFSWASKNYNGADWYKLLPCKFAYWYCI